jgi:hypothetical protein
MTYKNPTKSVFRIDIYSEKINTLEDIAEILRNLSDDLHTGPHDMTNAEGEVIGRYGTVRMLR